MREKRIIARKNNYDQRKVCHEGWRKTLSDTGGMVTVEVSFIVPVLFFLIAMLIFFLFFLTDMAAVKSETMRIAVQAGAAWKNRGELGSNNYSLRKLSERNPYEEADGGKGAGKEIEKQAETRLKRRTGERMILGGVRESKVGINNSLVKARGQVSYSLPLSKIAGYFGRGQWTFSCVTGAALDDWEEGLREGSARIVMEEER